MKKTIFTLFLLITAIVAKADKFDSFYPTTIELKQINSTEKERIRLCQGHKKYDKQPTGFYLASGKKVVVNVEILTPADNNVMPTLTVGTLGFNVAGRNTGTTTTLTAGLNTINAPSSGGLIWLSFIQNASPEPKGVAKITFTSESEHIRVPRFVHGTTITNDFREMLQLYSASPDVLYQSDYVVIVATKASANEYSKDNNKAAWMNDVHTLLEKEDEISGMDNDDPNPVHHRLKPGEVRYLLTENTSPSPHANNAGYTGYPSSSRSRYLTQFSTPTNSFTNGSWMMGHEVGHQHQQPAYMIGKASESTVNIYSYVVERHFFGAGYNRTTAAKWATARNTYLQLPFSKRIYDMPDDDLEAITGYNRDETRFMPWEQLFLIFGDQFYKTLHRVVREEKEVTGGSGVSDERRAYLIFKASQVSGYDLTEFFNLWGINVTDLVVKIGLRAKMANAKSKGEILDLSTIGRTAEELVRVTGQNIPNWAPVALRGITASTPEIPEIPEDRSEWTVVTSYAGPIDSTVGGNDPKYIIDESTVTAFLFVKPGMSYGGISIPGNTVPSFTVDMKAEKTIDYINYAHRTSENTSEQLRARQLSVYGSNNGVDFTPLKEHHVINYVRNDNRINVKFPQTTCRYIRVVIEDWTKTGGNTIQVADFQIGRVLLDLIPVKFRVDVTADSGIVTSQAGINPVDEESDYVLNFTLAENSEFESLTVDGDNVIPTENNGTYSLTVKVTNHLDIKITSFNANTGINTPSNNNLISIYPNPVKAGQAFSISLDGEFQDADVAVYSISGSKLSEFKIGNEPVEQTINNQGAYIIKVKKDGKLYAQRILVM